MEITKFKTIQQEKLMQNLSRVSDVYTCVKGIVAFPDGSVMKNPPVWQELHEMGFDPWVGKILWRRSWQPTPVFLPGESHGQRSLAGYNPWGHYSEQDTTQRLNMHTQRELYLNSLQQCFAKFSHSDMLYDQLNSILKSRDITLSTNVHLVKAMVFPVVMYGCESWTIKLSTF